MKRLKRLIKRINWLYNSYISTYQRRCRGYSAKIEKQLLDNFYFNENADDNDNDKSGIIMMFDGRCPHGGLTDRLKGITSIFSYCKERGIPIYINFCYPFHLDEYLVPHKVNWRINPKEINYNIKKTKLIVLYDFDIHPYFLKHWFDRKMDNWGGQIHIYTNIKWDNSFRLSFNELFKPSIKLQKEIDLCKKQIGGKFDSVSFRFTTLLGDFEDCINKPLPEDEQEVLIEKCLTALEKIKKTANSHGKILVTADSTKFLMRVRLLKYVYIIPGKVGHIDHQGKGLDDINMKTFLDFFMISNAEMVYLVRIGKMYNSGFCRYAAELGGKKFRCIEE